MRPYTILKACNYNDLNKHTPVFHLSALEQYMWVKIPKQFDSYSLYSIDDISGLDSKEVDFYDKVFKDDCHPWLKIPVSILDIRSGKHIYKLRFADPNSEEIFDVYISYVCQDDNPETPYIYMSGRGNTTTNTGKYGSYVDSDSDDDTDSTSSTTSTCCCYCPYLQ